MTTHTANNFFGAMRKFGLAGFAFFFVKGILWLLAPFFFAWII